MYNKKNRLNLDFSLETIQQRTAFIDEYLEAPYFKKNPLTNDELEMCANYILWGKDTDGKNVVQRKEIQIDTKNSTWTQKEQTESLEALMELPTFNENQILKQTEARPKVVKEVFSRSHALKQAPPSLIPELQHLFNEIDEIDYTISIYEFQNGKRKNPPREELIHNLSEDRRLQLNEKAKDLTQYKYLKLRHLLVELRQQQYTIKDSYAPQLVFERADPVESQPDLKFGVEVPVFPLGLKGKGLQRLLFPNLDDLYLTEFEEDLRYISDRIWEQESAYKRCTQRDGEEFFDFRELEHVYQLFQTFFEIEDGAAADELDESLRELLNTLDYYIELADLTPIYKEILDLKIKKVKNYDIAKYVNEKYGKTYTDNYISTIFRQKIIKAINEAAVYHYEVMNNFFYPENFKKCTYCGKLLLRDAHNFVRKARAKDGFTNRCKKCDKEIRIKQKERFQK